MICPHCEFEIEDNLEICPYCQTFVKQAVKKPEPEPVVWTGALMTKKEFMKLEQYPKIKRIINICAIFLYVRIALSILVTTLLMDSWLAIEALVILGLTLGAHLRKSKGCALALAIYMGISVLITLIEAFLRGAFLGSVIAIHTLAAAVFLAEAMVKLHKAWEEYEQTGIVPDADGEMLSKYGYVK
nr:hypothetical protein [Eubacterium sp.]